SEVNHTSSTDHRVPRRAPRQAPEKAPRRPTPGPEDLTPYHGHLLAAGDEEVARNHGVALMGMLERGLPVPLQRAYAAKALPLLDRAVERDATDVPALDSRADALWLLGRLEEARAGYDAALEKQPGSEG